MDGSRRACAHFGKFKKLGPERENMYVHFSVSGPSFLKIIHEDRDSRSFFMAMGLAGYRSAGSID